MMSYVVKASLLVVVILAFYKLVLQQESFFAANRMYLMVGLLLAFILPFALLPSFVENQGIVSSWLVDRTDAELMQLAEENSAITYDEAASIALSQVENSEVLQSPIRSYGISFWILLFYFFGVAILTLNLIAQMVKMWQNINKNNDRIRDEKYWIVKQVEGGAPCSFFNYILVSSDLYDETMYQQILEHEKIHAQKKHSLDLLVVELAIIVLWFNPFVWWFRKEVEKNAEYQTDAILLGRKTFDPEKYQMSLLEIASQKTLHPLALNYNQSLIKKRIIMMNTKNSNRYNYFKYAFIAPTLFVTLLLLNQPFNLHAQENVDADFHNEEGYSEPYSHHGDHSNNLPLLHLAAANGDEAGVKEILANGADVNEIALGDGSPLYLALQHDHWEVAKVLLENGANPNIGNSADGYPVLLAVATKDPELVKLLVRYGANVNLKYPGDGSAMIQAARNGDLNMVMELVALKASIHASVKGDGSPIIMAAKYGQLHIVKYLLKMGADVNDEVVGDETPLVSASEQGHLETVKFLIDKGANVNKVCQETLFNGTIRKRTALQMAGEKGHQEVVAYLISKGAEK